MEVINFEHETYKSLMKKIEGTLKGIRKLEDRIDELWEIRNYKEKEMLDNEDLCKIFKISKRTLQAYRDKGRLSFIKIDGKILYKPEDVARELEKNYFKAYKED